MSDKIQIFGSPLGMYSMLRGNYIISILRDDGTLDLGKLNKMLAAIANMGANALRDFFWIDTEDAYNKISPLWKKTDGSFEFNGHYFENQRKIAEMCNRYNMRYYLSLFDHCGTKQRSDVWKANPWRHHGDFFYGNDAMELRHTFIDRIIEAFDGLDAGVEVCNEPREKSGEFLADTFVYLIQKGFDRRKIILGIDYHLKEKDGEVGKDYRTLREIVIEKLGDENWAQLLKSECISPVHNTTVDQIDALWGPEVGPGGTRRIKYSMDGVQKPRPDKEMMFRITRKVLDMKREAREKGRVHFEVVYGKTDQDPLDSLEGVSEAYNVIFGEYPSNWKQFSQPLPLHDDEGRDDDDGNMDVGNGGTVADDSGTGGDDIAVIEPIPARSNRIIVEHAYSGILGREGDAGGVEAYAQFLDGGGSILEMCRNLYGSDEFKNKWGDKPARKKAKLLYEGILVRRPDRGGLKHSVEMIENGRAAERAAAMLESMEFKNRFL
jgi:hypothetical protein